MAKGCSVYIGNIDFDVPEQKIIDELAKIGRVVSFRMMIDKQTGKSKGYAFCEYESPLIAETAVQKLKIVFNNRQLKINYADTEVPSMKKEIDVPVENFTTVLSQNDKNNIKEVLLFLKKMAMDQPKKLQAILEENKTLGIAIFQALIDNNFIDNDVVYELLKKNYKIDDNKVQILERISHYSDEDLGIFQSDVQEKIKFIRERLLRK